ncbi:MAG: SMP-30/gluconolactonase/LRE family protein, partial [Planctomycetota bacterium]
MMTFRTTWLHRALIIGCFCQPSLIIAAERSGSLIESTDTRRQSEIVDSSSPLKRLPIEWGLPDGPSWMNFQWVISDVKQAKLFRRHGKTNDLAGMSYPGEKISGTFFQSGSLFLTDNPGCRILKKETGQAIRVLAELPEGHRPNDLVVDHDGNVFVTLTRQGTVVVIDKSGQASTLVDGLVTPNGIVLSPDQRTLYVSEMKPRRVMSMKLEREGFAVTAESPELLGSMNPDPSLKGGGDGMTIDRAGDVYCAGADGVYIWSRSGREITKIETPSRPINCVFGGAEGRTLLITCFDGVYTQSMHAVGVRSHPTAVPDSVRPTRDIVFHSIGDRDLLADVFVPAQAATTSRPSRRHPAVIVIHGGGWLKGDKTSFWPICEKLAAKGLVVMAAEYRLGVESPFPAAVQDVHAAVRWLKQHATRFNIDPDRITLLGGSAGGHLVGLVGNSADIDELTGAENFATSQISDVSSRVHGVIVMAGPMA